MGTQTAPQNERVTCPPQHKHGATSTCYGTHGCRCRECTTHNSTARTQYRKQKAYGRLDAFVDAAPVREHVNRLRAEGLGQDRISELAGVQINVVRHLLYGTYHVPPARRLRASNAEALLAVTADPELKLMRDPRGVRRRLQALAVQGWTFAQLAKHAGVRTEAMHSYLASESVTQATHDRIVRLFAELWDQQPPLATTGERCAVGRMRALAARKGWVGPLSWDDIDNDMAPVSPPMPSKGVRDAERDAVVERLHSYRYGDRRIAAVLGVDSKVVWQIRARLGLAAWTKEQQEAA